MFGVRKKNKLVGVDIGESSVKLVQVACKGNTYNVERVAIEPLDRSLFVERKILDTAQVGAIIYSALDRHGFSAKQAVACVNYGDIISKRLSVRADLNPRELEQWIEFEVAKFVPFPVAELNMDYRFLSDKSEDGRREMQVIACRKQTIDGLVSCINSAKLEPAAVDIAYEALIRSAGLVPHAEPGLSARNLNMIVDIGASSTRFYVCEGREMVFQRDEPFGGGFLISEMAAEYSMLEESAHQAIYRNELPEDYHEMILKPYIDWILRELERAILAFEASNTQGEITTILLAGGSARIADLDKTIHKRVRLDVKFLNPFSSPEVDVTTTDPDVWSLAPQLATACGLAMWSAT